jgi:hypothetical protein
MHSGADPIYKCLVCGEEIKTKDEGYITYIVPCKNKCNDPR